MTREKDPKKNTRAAPAPSQRNRSLRASRSPPPPPTMDNLSGGRYHRAPAPVLKVRGLWEWVCPKTNLKRGPRRQFCN